MTSAEHAELAEGFLRSADQAACDNNLPSLTFYLGAAQVHATLAGAAAMADLTAATLAGADAVKSADAHAVLPWMFQ